MPSSWQLDCLADRIRALQVEIQRVSDKDHPYREPRIVYRALLSVIAKRSKRLSEHRERFRGSSGERILENYYETASRDVDNVAEVFRLVDRVDSARIPFEILRSLSWVAKDLVGGTYSIVVRLDPVFNYSITSVASVFNNMLGWQDDWAVASNDPPLGGEDVLLLGIPSALAGSILLNALAAHELGHLLFAKRKESLGERISTVFCQVFPKHIARLEDYVATLMYSDPTGSIPDKYGKLATRVSDLAKTIVVNWCTELYCDMVGIRLLGPSYLAAFDRVLVGKARASDSHPPSDLRKNLMNLYCEKEFPNIASDPTWGALKGVRRESSWRDNPLWIFGEEVCNEAVSPFTEDLKSVRTPLTLPSHEWNSLISEIEEYLENLAPPSSVLTQRNACMDSSGFWLIFYAAWHYRVNQERFYAFANRYNWTDDLGLAEDALSNLVLQGLRSLELKYRWAERNSTEKVI